LKSKLLQNYTGTCPQGGLNDILGMEISPFLHANISPALEIFRPFIFDHSGAFRKPTTRRPFFFFLAEMGEYER
jgi:hypothetical protein